jgi:predicted ABC-type ATPase
MEQNMLSQDQLAIIDKIPNEGSLTARNSAGVPLNFSEAFANDRAELAFQGKEPAPQGGKIAIILHGAPGAGKSSNGLKNLAALKPSVLDSMVVVSYDEGRQFGGGAIHQIPLYRQALMQMGCADEFEPTLPETLDQRRALHDNFRALSQYIRSLTLKKALTEGYSIFVDTVSGNKGTIKLIEALRKLGYDRIEMWSTMAPFDLRRERAQNRPRPVTEDDLVEKGIGAFSMIPDFLPVVDRFAMYSNPENGREPVLVAEYKSSMDEFVLSNLDPQSLAQAFVALTNPNQMTTFPADRLDAYLQALKTGLEPFGYQTWLEQTASQEQIQRLDAILTHTP